MSVEHPKRDLAFKWLQVPRTYVYILKIHTKNCYQARGRREIWQKNSIFCFFGNLTKITLKQREIVVEKFPFPLHFLHL